MEDRDRFDLDDDAKAVGVSIMDDSSLQLIVVGGDGGGEGVCTAAVWRKDKALHTFALRR